MKPGEPPTAPLAVDTELSYLQAQLAAENIGAAVSDSALKTLAAIGLRGPYARYGSMTGGQLAESLLGASLDPDCVEKVLETDGLRRFLA